MRDSNSTPAAPSLQWRDDFLLGYGPMDEVHEEFVACVTAVQQASDEGMDAAMDALRRHLESHFQEENEWMERTEFPPRQCHIDEHNAVMASVYEVQEMLKQERNAVVCRELANELARWFPGHADYLDSALAHWMCKQNTGGKPVVLRRQMEPSPLPAGAPEAALRS